MIEGLKLSIPQRMQFLRMVITLSLLISICLSLNLWGGYRTFPYIPIFKFTFIKAPYDCVFILVSSFCLLASLFFNATRTFIFLALLLNLFLVLLDLNRLQPWFYYYNAILFIFLFYDGRVDDSNKFTTKFIILQLLISSIYIYSGLNKLNSNFITTSFLEIIYPLKNIITDRQFLFLIKMGITLPYILIFIGVGLIITPLRYLAITFGCIVHLSLLIFMFPSATNQNYALWFMNVVFLIILFILFSGRTKQRYFSPVILLQQPLFYICIFVFWILPFFNFVNKYPANLSSNFKSGNNNELMLFLNPTQHNQLPLYMQNFFIQTNNLYQLQYNKWCLNELKADCYPENQLFSALYIQIAQPLPKFVKETQFIIKPQQNLFSNR